MRLYKKIVKGLFISFVLAIFIAFFYEVCLRDVLRTGEFVCPSYDVWIPVLLFLIGNLSVALFHIHFFNVYKTNRIWLNTTVLEIIGFIVNFVYSGVFVLIGLFYFFSELDTRRVVQCLLASLTLAYGSYLFVESIFIIRYLKRDTTKENSRSIEEIGLS